MRIYRFISALLMLFVAAPCLALSLDHVEETARSLKDSPYAVVGTAGKSSGGRKIPYFVITDPHSKAEHKLRVLVISGQHGNESASAEATLDFARKIALQKNPRFDKLRNRVLFVIVPVVNPDGVSSCTRFNASGADLNRDWAKQKQPEVRAVAYLDKVWMPELVLDLHEWLVGDKGNADFIETCTVAAAKLRDQALSDSVPAPLRAVSSRPGGNSTLAHRYFASRGALTFLVETHRRDGAIDQGSIYQQCVTGLVDSALNARGQSGFRAGTWTAPEMPVVSKVPAENTPARSDHDNAHFVIVGSYVLIIAVLKSASTRIGEGRKRPHIRLGGIHPRPEHDVMYWMNRQGITCRSVSKRHTVLL